MSAFAKVLTLVPLVILFLPNIASNSVPEFSSMNENIRSKRYVAANSSNTAASCDPKISQSALKDVLKLMSSSKTNVIDLHVWIESANNTMNKTRALAGIKWANEIGRTLISLIAQTEESQLIPYQIMLLPRTMTAGIYGVNIVVTEETMRCLLSGNNISDHVVFYLLIHQLYYISGYETNYKLCRLHTTKLKSIYGVQKYNCCTIFEGNDTPICSDYSSIVIEKFPILILVTVSFVVYIDFPIILEYLSHYKENKKHYRVSDSPMSLSFMLHSTFIEGHGPAKSFGRKLTFALFVLVTTLPEQGYLQLIYTIFLSLWLLLSLSVDILNFHEHDHLNNSIEIIGFHNPIEIIASPFNLKFWWRTVGPIWLRLYRNLTLNSCIPQSETNSELHPPTTQETWRNDRYVHQSMKKKLIDILVQFFGRMKYYIFVLFSLVFYLITLPFLCCFAFAELNLCYRKYLPTAINNRSGEPTLKTSRIKCISSCIFMLITVALIVFSTSSLLFIAFYFTVGLFLNGEIYSPYFVPLSTIIFYAWTTWRSSVETKYLVLATNIYEVCHESVPVEGDERSNNTTENASNSDNTSRSSTTGPFTVCFKIELDGDGEPMMPKALYNLVREKFLPYDRILFHYFHGVFFIGIFAYLLFIMMSLAETSESRIVFG